MVEILRPAHHSAGNDSETILLARVGAPTAPFLAQLMAQGLYADLTYADVADRYETAAALTGEPQRVCIATL